MSVLLTLAVGVLSLLVLLVFFERKILKYKTALKIEGPGRLFPLLGNGLIPLSLDICTIPLNIIRLIKSFSIEHIVLVSCIISVTAFSKSREFALKYKYGGGITFSDLYFCLFTRRKHLR